MFGKKKHQQQQGPLAATLDWRDIRMFSAAPGGGETGVTDELRRRCAGLTPVWAAPAKGMVPRWGLAAFVDAPVEGPKADGAFGLFTDPEYQRPICRLLEPEIDGDSGLRYTATDERGETIGTITKVAPTRRPFKHTWRITTPDGLSVQGRNAWATKQRHVREARGYLNPLTYVVGAADDSSWATGNRGRELFWVDPADDSRRANTTYLMSSTSADFARLTDQGAGLLDRRLALLAVIGEARSLDLKPPTPPV
ncbi:hypothetical protein [Streptomyces bohaiensis]|uniref:hypothetical protein n=1 Tax=Streptomyces bohaiensis TaxID=1431344 RepID=UPI003B7A8316